MKFLISNLYKLTFTLLFINTIIPINGKAISNGDKIINNKEDRYYLIYINNTYGEYKIYNDSEIQKREESQIFIESLIDKINDLIIDNKDSYQNPEKLVEIEEISKLNRKKRNNEIQEFYTYIESNFVYPISSVNDRVVLYAYLSNKLVKKIKKIDKNIIDCELDQLNASYDSYYNKNDILAETGWRNLKILENAPFHLSLLSQGKYDKDLVSQYDSNYYYPSSAGKDIDIIIIDTSFNFDYSEFLNKPNGDYGCVATVQNGRATSAKNSLKCGSETFIHGRYTSDLAAGYSHGVANQANVYGISIPIDNNNKSSISDILAGLQYVHDKMVRQHKTIINLSIGLLTEINSNFHIQAKKLVDSITKMGGIIVSSAGNSGRNIDSYGENGKILVPCALDNVICVGGYNNQFDEDIRNLYKKHKNSNYGSTIDIYAPYHAETVTVLNGKVNKNSISGTSLSSPLVAGMIATIMSENILNSNVKYTKETIYKELIKLGKSETITVNNKICYLANNGKHIVYSSDKKYIGCGIHAGNISCNDSENKRKDRCGPGYGSCSNNDCCSKYGWCDTTPEHCGVGCQPEYGLCTSSSSSSPEIPISAVKDRCGPNYGACAKPNTCCSKYGWCDTSSTHCGKGCQPEYGICH